MYYILDGHEVVEEPDIMKWAQFLKDDYKKRVALTEIDGVKISTVFLGIDHGYNGERLLFETMIFGGEHDQDCFRYGTWDEAVKGHEEAVKLLKDDI